MNNFTKVSPLFDVFCLQAVMEDVWARWDGRASFRDIMKTLIKDVEWKQFDRRVTYTCDERVVKETKDYLCLVRAEIATFEATKRVAF